MKRIVSLISVAIMLTTAVVANADQTVFSGSIYDVVITDPVPVGANPAGENLLAFMMSIVNTTGLSGFDPAGFNGTHWFESNPNAPDGPDYTGITGVFHNQFFDRDATSPLLEDPVEFTTDVDTHFNLLAGDVLFVGFSPSETNDGILTAEPFNAVGGWADDAKNDFGDRLYGNFAVNGGVAANVDGDGDPSTWQLVYIVVPTDSWVTMDFFVTGGVAGSEGEDVTGTFQVVPEPATMSLLAIGGIGALLRRRK